MEINQVDRISSESLNSTRPVDSGSAQQETKRPEQTESTASREAYQVELSEEARQRQADEQQAAQSGQQAATGNAAYNASGEIAG